MTTKFVVFSKSHQAYVYRSQKNEGWSGESDWIGHNYYECSNITTKHLLSRKGVANKWAAVLNGWVSNDGGRVGDYEVLEITV